MHLSAKATVLLSSYEGTGHNDIFCGNLHIKCTVSLFIYHVYTVIQMFTCVVCTMLSQSLPVYHVRLDWFPGFVLP